MLKIYSRTKKDLIDKISPTYIAVGTALGILMLGYCILGCTIKSIKTHISPSKEMVLSDSNLYIFDTLRVK